MRKSSDKAPPARRPQPPAALELKGRLMEETGRRNGDPTLAQRGRRAQLRAQLAREAKPHR